MVRPRFRRTVGKSTVSLRSFKSTSNIPTRWASYSPWSRLSPTGRFVSAGKGPGQPAFPPVVS